MRRRLNISVNQEATGEWVEGIAFLQARSEGLLQSPLFKFGGNPILAINGKKKEELSAIFQKMIQEQDSDYPYKDDH